MEIKLYKILKTYPSIPSCFQVGDYIYLQELIHGSDRMTYRSGEGVQYYSAARSYFYKKLLNQPNDPSIPADEVESSPEYFEEIKDWQIYPKFDQVIIEDPGCVLVQSDKDITVDITTEDIKVKNGKLVIHIPEISKLKRGWANLLK